MNTTSPNPRRRFLRFSLRGLLLLVALVGAGLGWVIHEAKKQGIAVAALEELACVVDYDDSREPPTLLERLRAMLGEQESRSAVSVYGANEDSLVYVRALPQLIGLDLGGTG